MKSSSSILLVVLLVASGCRDAEHKHADSDHALAVGPQFSAKHGLMLPEKTRQSLGLRIVEVSERLVAEEQARGFEDEHKDSAANSANGREYLLANDSHSRKFVSFAACF